LLSILVVEGIYVLLAAKYQDKDLMGASKSVILEHGISTTQLCSTKRIDVHRTNVE
jgi:hypothetical protein